MVWTMRATSKLQVPTLCLTKVIISARWAARSKKQDDTVNNVLSNRKFSTINPAQVNDGLGRRPSVHQQQRSQVHISPSLETLMRFARYQRPDGMIQHGLVDGDSLEPIVGDMLGSWHAEGSRLKLGEVRLLAPIVPPNLIAIGRNYLAHAKEGNSDAPKEPIVFLKATTAITHPGAAIPLPVMAPGEVDYEAELAVIIGRTAVNVDEESALNHVFGYTCANDVSARDCQRGDAQWARAKSFDGFAPMGPWIETELDPAKCRVRLRLNGRTLQDASTELMIFSVRTLISYLSRCMTLLPGTVILTGTPAGCGFAQVPPLWMKAGDKVSVDIEGIGELHNTVTAASQRAAGARS
jgi:2-keto-4-pentenoate hydratase/2-oxohepta-3-ene-1,7-dioic acid hydratase in catechol pathway